MQAARTAAGAPARVAAELADAAHELKTPIAIALALCASARQNDDPIAVREDLTRIEAHVRSLRDQLEAVLDVDRRGHAQRSPATRADLATIVLDATDTYDLVAAQRDVQVSVELDGSVEAVVDAERIAVAVRNLVSNAVKHAPAGGHVRSTLVRDGAWARIEVADDGPGVPPAARESVFDRFRRLERDARRHAGSGLGLAIVREIATEHGGRVEIHDAPEGGALFTMELPLLPRRRPHGGRSLTALVPRPA